MVRIEDLPEPLRSNMASFPCPRFDTQPFVAGPPLNERRVALVSTAALIARGDAPLPFGSTDYRTVPASRNASDILTCHPSIAHDRSGFQRDINTVHPVDRLRELAEEGVIGGAAETHYSVMGSSDATAMVDTADQIAGQLRQERIDSVLFSPV